MAIEIRNERPEEYRVVEELTREAFWNEHEPGCSEHYLAHLLRDAEAFIPALDFVAIRDGVLVGNIMYSNAWVEDTAGVRRPVILFGPISVLPEAQGQGIGGALIRHSVDAARALGHRAVLIYGDPRYYSRFGFRPASAFGILTPDGTEHPALQALEIVPGGLDGVSGRFHEDPVYDTLRDEDVERFDAGFPPKEKGWRESQDRFKALAGGGE